MAFGPRPTCNNDTDFKTTIARRCVSQADELNNRIRLFILYVVNETCSGRDDICQRFRAGMVPGTGVGHAAEENWQLAAKMFALAPCSRTDTGAIKLYGRPGVEISAVHRAVLPVKKLLFLPGQGRLLSLLGDNTIHLWEINPRDELRSMLEEVNVFVPDDKIGRISACCLLSSGKFLLLGTEGGNVHLMDAVNFVLSDRVVSQETAMQNVPDDYKVDPGAVVALAPHPKTRSKVLIGYSRGLMVTWDEEQDGTSETIVGSEQLESVEWYRNGDKVISSHTNGTYYIWSLSDTSAPEQGPLTPFGPPPCRAISKISAKTTKDENFFLFTGGLPRDQDDRATLVVMKGRDSQVLEFPSRIVDFLTITDATEDSEHDNPHTLMVLTEEEVVAVDLETDGWPVFEQPYLNSPHSSNVTCVQLYTDVSQELWNNLKEAGQKQRAGRFSQRDWPIDGGELLSDDPDPMPRDLLVTGHEDGSIKFWDVSTVAMRAIYRCSTAEVFVTGREQQGQPLSPNSQVFDNRLKDITYVDADALESGKSEEEQGSQTPGSQKTPQEGRMIFKYTVEGETKEGVPPIRKIGLFDPFSDDPRLAVQHIELCPSTGIMAVGGASGQVVIMEMSPVGEGQSQELVTSAVDITAGVEGYQWKGSGKLSARNDVIAFPGFQSRQLIQCNPAAPTTALALEPKLGLVAVGTMQGLAMFDYRQKRVVSTRCTMTPEEIAGSLEPRSQQRKSLRDSLRRSIRKFGKGSKRTPSVEDSTETVNDDAEFKAVRASQLAGSTIKSFEFSPVGLNGDEGGSATLFVGTNSGKIMAYDVKVPKGDDMKRMEEEVTAEYTKEVQLQHGARSFISPS
ncbi:hypothetical protein Bbelb_145810 [Branchiostoma belcheri]|nr:hypothetical protein Bbelb_145810 [Branchiostoma belcheri]